MQYVVEHNDAKQDGGKRNNEPKNQHVSSRCRVSSLSRIISSAG
jgi:hypothetical protein